MTTPKILAFAGSTRRDSYNKVLVNIAAEGAKRAGAEITVVHLNDYPMPLYDGDLEANQGIPESALAFKKLLREHHGFLIASPEYNGSMSGVLKNAIDWASRQAPQEESLQCFKNKTVSLMSASPGALGGLRGLIQLRTVLAGIGCLVLPNQVAIAKAQEAMKDGQLVKPAQQNSIEQLGTELAIFLQKLS